MPPSTRREWMLLSTASASRLLGADASEILTKADWRRHCEQTRAGMVEVMGPLPKTGTEPPQMQVVEEVSLPGCLRRKITFESGDGDLVPAYLFLPTQRARSKRAVLCLHQTAVIGKSEPAGLGGKPNLRYALELAERGFVTVAPDYPGFGDYKIDPYALGYQSATMKGIRNHRRAVDLLGTLREVDRKRIGVIGHSLGGHNSLFLAAFDNRIAAVVTSCGFTSFAKYRGGDLTGWSHAGYMPRIASVYDRSPQKMPFDFPGVLQCIAPRPLFINAPIHDDNFDESGVDDCVRAAQPIYEKVFHASDRLRVIHPDSGHDFPPAIRFAAYEFLTKYL